LLIRERFSAFAEIFSFAGRALADHVHETENVVWIMTILQAEYGTGSRLAHAVRSTARESAHHATRRARHFHERVSRWWDGLQRWLMIRAARRWRIMTERARQRRALARLSDRELRDIGITRYDVEFLLRQSRHP
jgi:uncharacterized protein YjiS (DUF1127 family)